MRVERDLIGEKELQDDNYFGIHTQRAIENFPITGFKTSLFPIFIDSFINLKKCSAFANYELGLLDQKTTDAIISACDQILNGAYYTEFVVDPIQGGAGTSMNMNVNEVVANIALEILGEKKGNYAVINPNDHVNMGQSTNDTYPSSIKVAVYESLQALKKEMNELANSFNQKAIEFKGVVKIGRTQLQDAVPMTFGQGFASYANQIETSIEFVTLTEKALLGLNMGATAIGTGISAHPGYKEAIEIQIKKIIGEDFYIVEDLFAGTQDASGFSFVSGGLKKFAVQLSKICNDLRLLSSGPRAGLGEIKLPERQAGSSIMPGKINPVIPEVVSQVCFQVIGYDTAISFACEGGQLELNAFEPLVVFNLLSGISMLINAMRTLRENCISGIKVNIEKCRLDAENNIGIVTGLKNIIGYKKSTEVARKCLSENKSVHQVVLELGYMNEEDLKSALDVMKMTKI